MMDIPWEREGSLLRGSGEAPVTRGTLRQLVGIFLEMAPEARRGVAIRVAGPDWTSEYGDAEIRELAARPEYSAGIGRWGKKADRISRSDEPGDGPGGVLVGKGRSGDSRT
jgi:hypothetical protein